MYFSLVRGSSSVGKCYRVLKWCLPLVALYLLLQPAVFYLDISYTEWVQSMLVNKPVDLYQIEITAEHPCSRLLRTVYFNGSDENTQAFDVGGCPLKQITGKGAFKCLKDTASTYILFIGDSRVRQLRDYLWKLLADELHIPFHKYSTDRVDTKDNVTVELLWRTHATQKPLFQQLLKSTKKPDLLFVGMGIWRARESHGEAEGLLQYERVLQDSLVPLKELATNHSEVFWVPQDPIAENPLDKRRWMLTTKLMDAYNSVAYKLIKDSDIHIWESSRLAADHFPGYHRDGVHFTSIVDQHKTQILLNWLCNHNSKKAKCCT